MTDTVLLIDGLNVFLRHFAANPSMTDDGHHVGGLVGFLVAVKNLLVQFRPAEIVVVWEGGGSLRRRSIYPDYKSKRRPQGLNRYYDEIPDTVENRNYQIAKLVELLRMMGVRQIYASDCEGDDGICVARDFYRRELDNSNFVIVSSDRDLYQLIDDDTRVLTAGKKRLIDAATCLEETSIHPVNFALAKAIVGDKGDNIPGAVGIGFRSIVKIAPEFATDTPLLWSDVVDRAREASHKSKAKGPRTLLESNELVIRNLKLVQLSIGSLPHTNVVQLESQLVKPVEKLAGKLDIMRYLIREKIQNVDVDSLYVSLLLLAKARNSITTNAPSGHA